MKQILLLLIVLTLFIPSCIKVGPDFASPCDPEQSHWTNDEAASQTVEIDDWWRLFNDPQLEELITSAARQNLTLRSAAMRVMEARAILGIAIGEFFPQTQEVVGDATKFGLSKNAPNSITTDRQFWDLNLGLSVVWELDFWGKFRRGIESAQEELGAQKADFDDVLVILLGDVASTYVAIRTFEERVDIIKHNVAIQLRSLEIVQARWQAGMVTELDVQQAKTLLASTEATLPVLTADYVRSKNALAVLLGVPPADIGCYLTTSGKIPTAPETIAIEIPCALLTRRPDIRRALHSAAAQSARIGIAESELYPSLSLTGFFGLNSSAAASRRTTGGNRKFFSADSLTYTFGGGFSWPILNYGRLINRVRAESSLFREAIFDYQNIVLVAYKEVEDALTSFFNSQRQVSYLTDSVKAANRATELSRTQYVEGIADYTRVLNTEQASVEQEEEQAIARGNIALSLIATYRALGGGWRSFTCTGK